MVTAEEVEEEGQMHNYSCSQCSCIGVVLLDYADFDKRTEHLPH